MGVPTPRPAGLADEEVHLWLLPRDPRRLRHLSAVGIDLLSGDERDRLDGFTHAGAARRFLLGRILMRRGLAAYLGADPRELVLEAGVGGKPRLTRPAMDSLAFNLSHARNEWVLAIARGRNVGVDVEAMDRVAAAQRIATKWYTQEENRSIAAQGEQAGSQALMLWMLKESVMKAVGRSVWEGLGEVQFRLDAGEIIWLTAPPEGGQADWRVMLGRLRGDHLLAVALRPAGPNRSRPAVVAHVVDGAPKARGVFRLLYATRAP